MRQLPAPFVAGVVCLFVGIGCGAGPEGPEPAALAFWQAVHDGDYEEARRYSDAASADEIERAFATRPFDEVAVGATLRSDTAARVETELRGSDGLLVFDTRLARGSEGWRVSVRDTAEEYRRASLGAAFGELDEALREGRKLIGDALARGAREASKALRRAQEEIDEAYPPLPEPDAP